MEPEARAKRKVPIIISMMHIVFSVVLVPLMSPYPTVVIVVTVK
jgi:hypothetical protein